MVNKWWNEKKIKGREVANRSLKFNYNKFFIVMHARNEFIVKLY